MNWTVSQPPSESALRRPLVWEPKISRGPAPGQPFPPHRLPPNSEYLLFLNLGYHSASFTVEHRKQTLPCSRQTDVGSLNFYSQNYVP